ncbi:sialidase domain-containing protein [Streptococcus sp. CSL10205-OR2]|uniref:sialidase domain-containing protein n=1 Tax=Streptococcus sp. CSL10205-OR2 TaxID=2980558 RepID=UPI0021D8FBA0|nr:sialidase domain-containing protein [Streptococcus sp. CSL10205-OR2]MCU9533787.1 exo-alpha-sialidase [Streptococcus sp. CSL10205-OR2]
MRKRSKELFDQRQRYSIRRLTVGTASVMIGCVLFGANLVSADETNIETTNIIVTDETTKDLENNEEQPVTEETKAKSENQVFANEGSTVDESTLENTTGTNLTEDTEISNSERPTVELEVDSIGRLYEENKVVSVDNQRVDSSNNNRIDLDEHLETVKALTDATVYMEFKLDSNSGFKSLFSASSTEHTNNYLTLYSNGGSIGVEGRNGGNQFYGAPSANNQKLVAGEWNSVAMTINSSEDATAKLSVYVNGELAYSDQKSANFIKDLVGVNRMQIGATPRLNRMHWGAPFDLKNLTIFNRALTAEEIAKRSAIFKREAYPERLTEDMKVSEDVTVFESGQNNQRAADGIYSYRIPALITTKKGTLIAAADARETHYSDWGNIGITIRRSTDQGATWSSRIDAINIRNNPNPANRNQQSPVTIDSVLLQDPSNDRIILIYDMFLEGQAIHSLPANKARYEEPYVTIEGKSYRALYRTDNQGESGVYTIRENGKVYSPSNLETEYSVKLESDHPAKETIGDIYQNNDLIGNIFFTTNKTSPFRAAWASYLWMQYSDDDGVTWSNPKDITPMVTNDQMKFHGVGPGAGIVLQHGEHKGRIIVPTYSTNYAAPNHLTSQSSRVIYSDDHGETWQMGGSPNDDRTLSNGTTIHSLTMSQSAEQLTESTVVELDSGALKLFMRNPSGRVKVATSTDSGQTWHNLKDIPEVVDVYVQLSAIHTHHNDKEYIILSNANGPARANGYLRVAEVLPDGELNWVNQKIFQKGDYAYNSLTKIGENNYGILYEHTEPGYNAYSLHFKSFNMEYALAQTQPIVQVQSIDKLDDYHFRLNFDKSVWALRPENLLLEDNRVAYFVSQDSPTSLIYSIASEDWGKSLKKTIPTAIINVNKIDVDISGTLPTADTKNVNAYDILRRVNNVTAKRTAYNKADITFAAYEGADYYFVSRLNVETQTVENFRTFENHFTDKTLQADYNYIYNVTAVKNEQQSVNSLDVVVSSHQEFMDDRDQAIEYGAAFGNWSDAQLYGGTEKFVDITGNTTLTKADYTAKVNFVGKGIEIYGIKSPSLSTATVKIDGVDRGVIDFHNATAQKGVLIGQFLDLEDGFHTLELTVNDKPVTRPGERNKFSLDSFRIISGSPNAPERLDDRDSRIQYGSAFGNYSDPQLYQATEKFADITQDVTIPAENATLTLNFEGTGIRVYGNKATNLGEALVTIDGNQMEPLVFYKPSGNPEKRTLIGEYKGLDNGSHSITIRVNPNATMANKKISLDSFEILKPQVTPILSPNLIDVAEDENHVLLVMKPGDWQSIKLIIDNVTEPIVLTKTADFNLQDSLGNVVEKVSDTHWNVALPTGLNREQKLNIKAIAHYSHGESNSGIAQIASRKPEVKYYQVSAKSVLKDGTVLSETTVLNNLTTGSNYDITSQAPEQFIEHGGKRYFRESVSSNVTGTIADQNIIVVYTYIEAINIIPDSAPNAEDKPSIEFSNGRGVVNDLPELAFSTAKRELKDDASGVSVQLEIGEIAAIEGISVGHKETQDPNTPNVLKDQDYDLFDISLVDAKGETISPLKDTLVIMPVDDGKTVGKVVYLPNTDQEEELDFTMTSFEDSNGVTRTGVVFVAKHFSEYGIIYQVPETKVPSDAPNYELPEGKIETAVPSTAPTLEDKPVFEGKLESKIPSDAPSYDLPEGKIETAIPNTAPSHELLAFDGKLEPMSSNHGHKNKDIAEKKANQTSPTTQAKVLPNTGDNSNSAVLGTMLALSSLALYGYGRKKRFDN